MMLMGLAFGLQDDREMVQMCQRLLAMKPAACIQESEYGKPGFRYTFLSEKGKTVFTHFEPSDILDFCMNADGDTMMVTRRGGYTNGAFARSTLLLVNRRGKVQAEEDTAGGSGFWIGNTIYTQWGKKPLRFARVDGSSAWMRSELSDRATSEVAANEDGSQIWLKVSNDNHEEAFDKLQRVSLDGKRESPVTLGFRQHASPTLLPGSDWLAFWTDKQKVAFVNTKTNASQVFEQTQVRPFVWVPKLGALAYMAATPNDHVDRYQFGLFYAGSAKNSVCSLPDQFILDYVGMGPDRLLVLTMERKGLTDDSRAIGAQKGRSAKPGEFDPRPRSLLIVDPVTGKSETVGTISDRTNPRLMCCRGV